MKNIIKLFSLCIIIFSVTNKVFAQELDYIHGHFKRINPQIKFCYGVPTKLQDGNILITSNECNMLFNVKTNKFEHVGDFKYKLVPVSSGVLLPDGKVLFLMNRRENINFYSKYENVLKAIVLKNKNYSVNSGDYNNAYAEFSKLSLDEKEKLYQSIINKYPSLKNEYDKYIAEVNNSYYGQLYNPKSKTFELTGKFENRNLTIDFINERFVPLMNGNVLIFCNNSFYIYDYKSGNFIPYKSDKLSKEVVLTDGYDYVEFEPTMYKRIKITKENPKKVTYIFRPWTMLNDGRVLGNFGPNFAIYNFNTDEMFVSKLGDSYSLNGGNIILSDDSIIFIEKKFNKYPSKKYGCVNVIEKYNPKSDEMYTVGETAILRIERDCNSFDTQILSDDSILMFGGEKTLMEGIQSNLEFDDYRVEIFNPKTNKSTVIKKIKFCPSVSILLDDGRVLMYDYDNVELFIPKIKNVRR